MQRGDELFYGPAELWATVGGTAFVIAVFIRSLMLTYQAEAATQSGVPEVSG